EDDHRQQVTQVMSEPLGRGTRPGLSPIQAVRRLQEVLLRRALSDALAPLVDLDTEATIGWRAELASSGPRTDEPEMLANTPPASCRFAWRARQLHRLLAAE